MKLREQQILGIGKTLGEPLTENSQATCTYKLAEISTENWLLCF